MHDVAVGQKQRWSCCAKRTGAEQAAVLDNCTDCHLIQSTQTDSQPPAMVLRNIAGTYWHILRSCTSQPTTVYARVHRRMYPFFPKRHSRHNARLLRHNKEINQPLFEPSTQHQDIVTTGTTPATRATAHQPSVQKNRPNVQTKTTPQTAPPKQQRTFPSWSSSSSLLVGHLRRRRRCWLVAVRRPSSVVRRPSLTTTTMNERTNERTNERRCVVTAPVRAFVFAGALR